MESVHGVDVSWLHRPLRDPITRARAPSSPAAPSHDIASYTTQSPLSPSLAKAQDDSAASLTPLNRVTTAPSPGTSPSISTPLRGSTITQVEGNAPRPGPRRPNLLNRTTKEGAGESAKSPRRSSWISNISSKFSTGSTPGNSSGPASPQLSKPIVNGSNVGTPQPNLENLVGPASPTLTRKEAEELQPYVPQKPKESGGSFFSSITRRLSTASQSSSGGRMMDNGGVCPRRTMNINPNRARCLVPELDENKLRRVSFSVDVEIAGGPKYKDDDAEEPVDNVKKAKDKKIKERAEGEALKHPQQATDIKEDDTKDNERVDEAITNDIPAIKADDTVNASPKDPKVMTRKQEKKKKSEEERKERKEKKRRKAEENGMLPVELKRDDSISSSSDAASMNDAKHPPPTKPHDRPTTDPVRIYRRCCQLRESPILKRITEQLMAPNSTLPGDPGTVSCLNLTGSRLQLADFITLGDWLAIVPVKRLLLEDADITDEGLRVVLAGLMAAKKPEPTRLGRKNGTSVAEAPAKERAGIVEKLNLKNNPRITHIGWKHLAVFLNMCRSIKAIDLSMVQFPDELAPRTQPAVAVQSTQVHITDAAEVFAKALAERQEESRLDELIMSGCGLRAEQIKKILDGAAISGVRRVGIAGNDLDDEGFEHILSYIRSSVCEAIDIGSNDLRGKMERLAKTLLQKVDTPFWGLALASGNLNSTELKHLFNAIVKLPNFRFLDLSHNHVSFENDAKDGVPLLRKYLPQLKELRRLHLMDMGVNAGQAIAIAEIIPEIPKLAHLSFSDNVKLAELIANTDEASQEEACALFASLMVAARNSSSIISIEIDVPPPTNSEVVKALAKQVVAYCLRNLERMPLHEPSPDARSELVRANGGTHMDDNHGGNDQTEVAYPDVLLHLVGHVDEPSTTNHDNDDPAPDDDYIVGGTGVVKALQYCLGEVTAKDYRRGSGQIHTPTSHPGSGYVTPQNGDRDQAASKAIEQRGRAKAVSVSLLNSARKIRTRLQPALIKEAASGGDELALRRLQFLDHTLNGMIQRFEVEFPECRVRNPSSSPKVAASVSSSLGTAESMAFSGNAASVTPGTAFHDSDDDEMRLSARPSRRGSEVSLASRALAIEEGRMHRIGHGIRQDILNAESPIPSPGPLSADNDEEITGKNKGLDDEHLAQLEERLEGLSGLQVKELVEPGGNWDAVMKEVGANVEELRLLKERDPDGWEMFVESQMAARRNRG